jgi:hypothetical protein
VLRRIFEPEYRGSNKRIEKRTGYRPNEELIICDIHQVLLAPSDQEG